MNFMNERFRTPFQAMNPDKPAMIRLNDRLQSLALEEYFLDFGDV